MGIDEAGRGPLAGPVAVGAFAVKSPAVLRRFRGVRDSKRLSEKQREEWFALIEESARNGEAAFEVSFGRAETIDSRGLNGAIYSALNRCLGRLEGKSFAGPGARVLMDGLLKCSSRYPDNETIIGGDSKEPVIALASICAKVLRDRRMKKSAEEFPGYGFEIHKGYGTKAHYEALKRNGLTPLHRRSFMGRGCPIIKMGGM